MTAVVDLYLLARQTLPARIRKRIAWPVSDDGCWIWYGARTKAGYGQSSFEGRREVAHRVIYRFLVDRNLSSAKELNHLCKVTSCVNPSHVEVLTPTEHRNLSRRTHCQRGHSMTDAYSRFYRGQIHRRCRPCTLEINRRSASRRLQRKAQHHES